MSGLYDYSNVAWIAIMAGAVPTGIAVFLGMLLAFRIVPRTSKTIAGLAIIIVYLIVLMLNMQTFFYTSILEYLVIGLTLIAVACGVMAAQFVAKDRGEV